MQHHLEGLDPSKKVRRVKRKSGAKKHGVKTEEGKRASEFGTPAGPLETLTVSLLDGRDLWRQRGDRSALRSKRSPVCVTCFGV